MDYSCILNHLSIIKSSFPTENDHCFAEVHRVSTPCAALRRAQAIAAGHRGRRVGI